jgi:hypothetical protein
VPIQIAPLRASKIVMMPAALRERASPGFTPMNCSRPSGESLRSPLSRVPIHRVPWWSWRSDITRASPRALCRPVIASMLVLQPLSSSYQVRPPPSEAIQTLLLGASAKAVTSLSPSQSGRWPPSSQLRGFQRLTPPARVPIHTRPVASWYSDMTKESRSEPASLGSYR